MRPLIALALEIAAYLLTQETVVGLLAAAVSFWFLQQSGRRRSEYTAQSRALDAPEHDLSYSARDGDGIAVVCKQVTPERQEWTSVRTGRLFEVLSPDGPRDARPGDHAQLVVSGTRYLVKAPLEPGKR